MVLLLTTAEAHEHVVRHVRARRLQQGLTQAGLARRAGVPLATLRYFEQKGRIGLQAFVQLLMVLGAVEDVVRALEPSEVPFRSIDEVLKQDEKKRKKGWRT
ncbi:MAG: helix-turn-helix domain-containing protein [Alphaproteobacteria bacterium GM202ARS2]|nr:helix-turn-helix domain-containing protein [Alphaproteobacteria bacterium GM202ARS2]